MTRHAPVAGVSLHRSGMIAVASGLTDDPEEIARAVRQNLQAKVDLVKLFEDNPPDIEAMTRVRLVVSRGRIVHGAGHGGERDD